QTASASRARLVNSVLTEDEIRCYINRAKRREQSAMVQTHEVVFLFDVDNTLLDNDHVQADLSEHLAENYGIAARDRYWEILRALVDELGYTDYLGALERYRIEAMHRPE